MLMGVMLGALIETGGISSIRQMTEFTAMAFPPVPTTLLQYILAVVIGVILGGMAINFQKFMIAASSAILGSAALVTGLGGSITQISSNMSQGAIMILAWLLLGLLGLVVQFRSMGEV
jgi:hypothetical protein